MAESSFNPADQAARINNAAASGDTTIVAAPGSGKRIRVHCLRLSVAGAVVVQIKTGTTVREVFNFAAAGNYALDLRVSPYYVAAENEAIVINASGAVQVDGRIEYTAG